jgi:hypothetical protein
MINAKGKFDRNTKVAAVLIGINYLGTNNQLGGCINDVLNMRAQILRDYPQAKITLLTDRTQATARISQGEPTRENILTAYKELVSSDAELLFEHYSGHGTQVRDTSGDEPDGLDEAICPIDFQTAGMITDDEIKAILMKVPKDKTLIGVFDCCHSGSIADLPDSYGDDTPQPIPQLPYKPNSIVPITTVANNIGTVIFCETAWSFESINQKYWITPINSKLKEKTDTMKIAKNYNDPVTNLTSRPKYYQTTWTEIAKDTYRIEVPALRLKMVARIPVNAVKEIVDSSDNRHFDNKILARHRERMPTCPQRRSRDTIPANIYLISGCQNKQTSADTGVEGACTRTLINNVIGPKGGIINFFNAFVADQHQIADDINAGLRREGFEQHVVVSSGTSIGVSAKSVSSAKNWVFEQDDVSNKSVGSWNGRRLIMY